MKKKRKEEKKHNHVMCLLVLIYIKPTYFFNIYVCICILWIQIATLKSPSQLDHSIWRKFHQKNAIFSYPYQMHHHQT